MSITVTTDVFCDGEMCGDWVGGTTHAIKSDYKGARKQARAHGWTHVKGKDLCPICAGFAKNKSGDTYYDKNWEKVNLEAARVNSKARRSKRIQT